MIWGGQAGDAINLPSLWGNYSAHHLSATSYSSRKSWECTLTALTVRYQSCKAADEIVIGATQSLGINVQKQWCGVWSFYKDASLPQTGKTTSDTLENPRVPGKLSWETRPLVAWLMWFPWLCQVLSTHALQLPLFFLECLHLLNSHLLKTSDQFTFPIRPFRMFLILPT